MNKLIEKMCRICEKSSVSLINITKPQNLHLTTKYISCANVTFDKMDKLPKYFCGDCIANLNSAYNFKQQCEMTQQKFYDITCCNIDDTKGYDNVLSKNMYENEMEMENKIEVMIKEEPSIDIMEDNTNPLNKFIDSNGVSFQCNSCQEKYKNLKFLKRHMMISHANVNIIKCNICETIFKHSKTLNRHMITHTKEKPYKCDICEVKFWHMDICKIHKRKHTGKPFKCKLCEMKFLQLAHLNRHLLTHTGAKPLKCDYCETSFRDAGTLKNHIMKHTGEKPFKCDVCGVKFRQSGSLRIHMLKHTGEKPYKCDVCNAKFRHKNSFKNHKWKHEQNENKV